MSPQELPGLRRSRPEECLSDLTLDRLRGGELEGTPEVETARAHLGACALCSARYQELEQLQVAFSREVWVAGEVAKAKRKARRPWLPGVIAPGLAVAAAAALFILLRPMPPQLAQELPTERLKGGLTLRIFKRDMTGKVAELAVGEPVSAGEQLRLEVSPPSVGHVRVVGVDAAGRATVYYPEGEEPLAPLPAGKTVLPGSIILDDTPGTERLVVLLCDTAVEVARVREAAERALREAGGVPEHTGRLALECEQSTFDLRKEPGR